MFKRKSYLELVLILFVVYFTADTESCNQNGKLLESHPTIVSNVIPSYFMNLFKPGTKAEMKLISSYEHIGKDTVCNFMYEGKYYLQVYRLSERFIESLNGSLNENHAKSELEVGVPFYDNQASLINIRDKMIVSKKDNPIKIFVSLNGVDCTANMKNDSVADYNLIIKNLSIKYSPNGPQEIQAEPGDYADQRTPLELMFIKNNASLYLLFLSPKNGISLPPKTLYYLIR